MSKNEVIDIQTDNQTRIYFAVFIVVVIIVLFFTECIIVLFCTTNRQFLHYKCIHTYKHLEIKVCMRELVSVLSQI